MAKYLLTESHGNATFMNVFDKSNTSANVRKDVCENIYGQHCQHSITITFDCLDKTKRYYVSKNENRNIFGTLSNKPPEPLNARLLEKSYTSVRPIYLSSILP